MYLSDTLQPYLDLLPEFLIALVCALILTPVVGHFAHRFGFVDLPAAMRKRIDSSVDTRIHTDVKARLGGLAVFIPAIIIIIFNLNLNLQLGGLLLAIVVVLIAGAIDEHKDTELSSSKQFAFQFLASLIIVLSGTTITNIQIVGVNFDFNLFSHIFTIGNFTYNFIFPADIITILWIMGIINALKWVFGVDSLGETITAIACTTLTMLSIKFGNFELALITAVLAGGILGFLPFNLFPAKIFSGAGAQNAYGLILATISIMGGAKITTSILLLSIPLADMIWVIIYRIRKYQDIPFFKRPVMRGRTHLHHRLMELGFTVKQTVLLESVAMVIISIIAFYFSGFSAKSIAILIVLAGVFVTFLVISLLSKKKSQRRPPELPPEPPTEIKEEITPEERYAY